MVLFVSLLSLLQVLLFIHNTKFFHFIFLFVSLLSIFFSNFENSECILPQLKHPKGVEVHNTMWRPKVAQANNNIQRLKAAKSNNVTMSVFCTFPFYSIFLLSILQNTIIYKFFMWISPLH
jgi:hypothetical protein